MSQSRLNSDMIDHSLGSLTASVSSTLDLGSVPSDRIGVGVLGTPTITSLGSATNKLRFVYFSGALTLTHNATSLILPTGTNIVTAANDCAIFASDGSGNWRCILYQRATGAALSTTLFDIAGLTAETAPATGDYAPIYDVSASANRKMTLANLFTIINAFTQKSTLAVADKFAIYDVAGTSAKYATAMSILEMLSALTEDTATLAADYLLEYDASAATVKKTKNTTIEKTMYGTAKAWAYITVSGGTPTAAASFNVSSLTDTGTGIVTPNYTAAMASSSYASVVQTVASVSLLNHSAERASASTTKIDLYNYEGSSPATTDPYIYDWCLDGALA